MCQPANWVRTTCVQAVRKSGHTKTTDVSQPTADQIRDLQAAFDLHFPEHHVDLRCSEPKVQWEWVNGFKNIGQEGLRFEVGQDVAVAYPSRHQQYINIQRCLSAICESKVYHFVYGLWYQNEGARYPLYGEDEVKFAQAQHLPFVNPHETVVTKWDPGENRQNTPIPLHQVSYVVMMQHRCVRRCLVNDTHENCTCHEQCRTHQVCENHPGIGCQDPSCKSSKSISWIDSHNSRIKEYTVCDPSWGFQATL